MCVGGVECGVCGWSVCGVCVGGVWYVWSVCVCVGCVVYGCVCVCVCGWSVVCVGMGVCGENQPNTAYDVPRSWQFSILNVNSINTHTSTSLYS